MSTPRTARAAAAVLVTAAALALSAGSGPAPPPLALGVAGEDTAAAARFTQVTGAPAAVSGWYESWAGWTAFDTARADAAVAAGALPLVTWEPWDPRRGRDQPEFALSRIAAGDHDAYVADFARQVRDWGGVVAVRFAHELDAPHYPWSVGVNGNTAEDALAAWHRVRGIFRTQGADVVWVWCVNVHAPGTAPYAPLYPGDNAVDWLALDGYNGGTALPWGGWRSPRQVFGESLADLRALSDRPVLLTEVGSAEEGGDKAGWIHELFGFAAAERVSGLVWFDVAKEADWRIASSPRAAAAFRAEAGAPGRLGPLPLPARFRAG